MFVIIAFAGSRFIYQLCTFTPVFESNPHLLHLKTWKCPNSSGATRLLVFLKSTLVCNLEQKPLLLEQVRCQTFPYLGPFKNFCSSLGSDFAHQWLLTTTQFAWNLQVQKGILFNSSLSFIIVTYRTSNFYIKRKRFDKKNSFLDKSVHKQALPSQLAEKCKSTVTKLTTQHRRPM